MSTVFEELNENITALNEEKALLKSGFESMGVDMTDVPFTQYHEKFDEIQIGGGDDPLIGLLDGSITSVTIPSSITNLKQYAFADTNIETLVIPDNIQTIESYLCRGCTKLKSVTFNGTPTIDTNYMFYQCPSLEKVTLPNSIELFVSYTFSGCEKLKEIFIPASVKGFGYESFNNTALEKVIIQDVNRYSEIIVASGSNPYPGNSKGITYLYLEGNENYITDVVLDTATSINPSFRYISGIKSIYIGESVTKVNPTNSSLNITTNPYGTLMGMKDLESLTFSENSTLTTLKEDFCRTCKNLKTIVFPPNLTSIPNYCCQGCSSLTEITLPEAVKTLGTSCFQETALTSITIPNSVTTIYASAFQDVVDLTYVKMSSSLTRIYQKAFYVTSYQASKLLEIDFSESTSIPTLDNVNAFDKLNSECKIYVPDDLYDSWKTATNWSTYASRIYKASEKPTE